MTPDLATVTTRELLDEIEIRCKNRPCYGGNPPPVVDPVEIPGARVTIIEGRRPASRRGPPPLEEPINMYDAIVTKPTEPRGLLGWLFG